MTEKTGTRLRVRAQRLRRAGGGFVEPLLIFTMLMVLAFASHHG